MARIRVNVLGPVSLEVDGLDTRLKPLTARTLIRLVAADGEAVPVSVLRRDVWARPAERAVVSQRNRNEVQKRILELRRIVDPSQSGEGTRILRTEQVFTAHGAETAYRLVLSSDCLDSAEFSELVRRGLQEAPASAAATLERAVALWRGSPLGEAGGAQFAQAMSRRLHELYESACTELIYAFITLGRYESAVALAERIAAERPGDPDAVSVLAGLRVRVRERRGGEILRRELSGLRTTLVVTRGDLFEQHDANLVAGFTDTFDVATGRDFVIARESVQGQVLDRLFGGDPRELDRELRRGLRQFAPESVESTRDKSKGKRVRYPIGTVVPLAIGGRRLFATAYSRLGNDLVARSSPELLRLSLDELWTSVARHGLFKPVAIPLVGSGLARVTELSREELMIMIIDTFVHGCRKHTTISPELRIVLREADLEKTLTSSVARFVETLNHDGIAPGSA